MLSDPEARTLESAWQVHRGNGAGCRLQTAAVVWRRQLHVRAYTEKSLHDKAFVKVRFDINSLILYVRESKRPKRERDLDEKTVVGNMLAYTYPATSGLVNDSTQGCTKSPMLLTFAQNLLAISKVHDNVTMRAPNEK